MSQSNTKYLLARINVPIREPLEAFAHRLTQLMPGFVFEEETTCRYEEVPAYEAERHSMKFVLFGVPDGEVGDEYELKFVCKTELGLEELLARDEGTFMRQFVHEKFLGDSGLMDYNYSQELATLLVELGIPGCKPILPVT